MSGTGAWALTRSFDSLRKDQQQRPVCCLNATRGVLTGSYVVRIVGRYAGRTCVLFGRTKLRVEATKPVSSFETPTPTPDFMVDDQQV
jgi:hypothetical protein